MKRTFCILLIVPIIFSGCKNSKLNRDNSTSDPPTHVDNVKTDKHVQIQARLFLIPPDKFEPSQLGLKKDDKTMIVAFDQVYDDYFEKSKNFDRVNMEKKGAKVLEYFEFTFGDYPAKFISMQTTEDEKKMSLMFGDKTFIVLITGMYPSSDFKSGEIIRKTLLSVYFRKSFK